ncbi:lipopolysaccharide biosynthesis protein [Methylobacterium sp. A54F]
MAAGVTLGTALLRLQAVRTGPGRAALDVFAVRIASAGFAYLAQVLIARLMGREEYGVFAAVWVWVTILGHSATLGFSQGASRFLPADHARNDAAAMRGFLRFGALATLATALGAVALGAAFLAFDRSVLAGPYGPPLLAAALLLPLFALQDYCEGVARSQNWVVLAIAPPYLLRQALTMAALAAAIGLGAPAEAGVAMGCMALSAGLSGAVQAGVLLRRLRTVVRPGTARYAARAWLSACLPIAAIDLTAAGLMFVDVVILGLLLPPTAVGLYFAATRLQQFVAFVHFAASAATAPRLSAAHASGERATLVALVRRQAQATCGATLLVGLGVLAASPLLLAMFGPEFRAAVPVLAILVAGACGASLFGPGEDLLTMLGGERLCAGITVAALALAAVLCFALVPLLGPLGAALAMATVAILRAAALARAARRMHGLTTPVWSRGGDAR